MAAPSMKSFNWDWNHSSQSGEYFIKCRNQLVGKCLNNHSTWRRFTGIPLYVAYASLTLVEYISLIGEQIIKGIGNLLKAFKPGGQYKAEKGAKQLLLLVPINILAIILSPVRISFGLAVVPLLMVFIPNHTGNLLASLTREQRKDIHSMIYYSLNIK